MTGEVNLQVAWILCALQILQAQPGLTWSEGSLCLFWAFVPEPTWFSSLSSEHTASELETWLFHEEDTQESHSYYVHLIKTSDYLTWKQPPSIMSNTCLFVLARG